jgi:hypothetical protein
MATVPVSHRPAGSTMAAPLGTFPLQRRFIHFGTAGHSRACATSRDTAWNVLETLDRDQSLEKLLQTHGRRCPRGRKLTTSLLERSSRSRPARRRSLRIGIDILLAMRSQVRLADHWRNSYNARATTTDSHLEGATGRTR